MDVYLETERLILRRFTQDDLDDLVALNADPAVTHFINGGRPIPRDEIQDDLTAFMLRYERGDGYGLWAAIEKASGEFLGWFYLRPARGGPSDEPELGYRLRRAAWGHGYGTEGSRALIDKAFRELGARRVFASTMTINIASRRVMMKAGLRFVRLFFQEWPDAIPGDHLGDVEYALTRAEWERQQST
jgi:RimJ/RimL family protein N-acetyltransferase